MTRKARPSLKDVVSRDPTERVKVAVALRSARPGRESLERLRALGLSIDRVAGNKILGSVSVADKPAVAADPEVVEIEEGARLSLS